MSIVNTKKRLMKTATSIRVPENVQIVLTAAGFLLWAMALFYITWFA